MDLKELQCPHCAAGFSYQESTPGYGILRCACDRWPVVDGIPILQKRVAAFEHTRGAELSAPVTSAHLAQLIESGRSTEALVACLTYPTGMRRASWLGWRVSHALGSYLGRARTRGLLRRRDALSSRELIAELFRSDSPLGSDLSHYYSLRIGQPRHLAALALLEQLEVDDDRPIADLGCGLGHFEHYLNAVGRRVIRHQSQLLRAVDRATLDRSAVAICVRRSEGGAAVCDRDSVRDLLLRRLSLCSGTRPPRA